MDINPEKKTIENLLGSGRQFKIPRFQREYSWEKKNYQEFLDDMLKGLSFEKEIVSSSQYFLGTMLFIGDFTDGTRDNIIVVDGQQRMTTITILFAVISDYFKSQGHIRLSKQIFKYIMTEDNDGEEVRVLVTTTSYPFFSYYIQDYEKHEIKEPASEEEANIKETYDFFTDKLKESELKSRLIELHNIANENIEDYDYIDILKALRDQVLNSIFVSISTSNREQANRIFEILNAKGKRLESIDLIKNKIFEVLDKTEPVDFASEKWKRINMNLQRGEEPVGIGTFFRHYWQSKYKNLTMRTLYDDFTRTVKQSEYMNFLSDLENNSVYYMKMLSPRVEDYDNRKEYYWLVQSLKALNDFSVVQSRIFLMALFEAYEKRIVKPKLFKETVKYIENFHFAYNAISIGKANNKVNRHYSRCAINLRKAKNANEVRVIIEDLKSILDSLFPEYSLFSEQFVKLEYSKDDRVSNIKTKYVLNKIYCYFQCTETYATDMSVEHILPESSCNHALGIGNLIALEGNLNNALGELPYSEKREDYLSSNYNWVKKFTGEYNEWDESDISPRAEKLAKLYYEKILLKTIEKE